MQFKNIALLFIFICITTSVHGQFANNPNIQNSDCFMNFISNGKGPNTGYKGFVDIGFTCLGAGPEFSNFNLTTTHGCQINKYLYIGGGIGVNYYNQDIPLDVEYYKDYWGDVRTQPVDVEGIISIPLYADARLTIDRNISPFIDVKVGRSIGRLNGLFFKPTIGCRFSTSRVAYNIGIGIAHQPVNKQPYYSGESYTMFTCTLGVDF